MFMSGIKQEDSPFKFWLILEMWASCRDQLREGSFGSQGANEQPGSSGPEENLEGSDIGISIQYWYCKEIR